MYRHAEEMKKIGSGLLSESNHMLKKDIAEVKAIMESEMNSEPTMPGKDQMKAMLELEGQTVQFIANGLSKLGEYDPDEMSDAIRNFVRQMFKNKALIKKNAKQFARRGAKTVARQIKRGI